MAHAPHIDSEVSFVNVNGEWVNKHQAVNQHASNGIFKVLPRSNLSNTALAGGVAELAFDLPHGSLDYLNCVKLACTLTNAGVGALDLVDAYSLVDYIELQANGVPLQTLYGKNSRDTLILGTDVLSRWSSALSNAYISGTTYNSTLSIGAGLSVNPISSWYNTMLTTANFPMWLLPNVQFRIVVRFNTGANALVRAGSVATIADLRMSDAYLLLYGQILADEVRSGFTTEYMKHPKLLKYLHCTREVLNLGATVSGNQVQAHLTSTGTLSHAFLDYRNNAVVAGGEDVYTPLTINAFEMLYNNQVITHGLGDNGYTYAIHKSIAPEYVQNTDPLNQKNVAFITFSENIMATVASGANYGYRKCTGGSEVVRIVPGVTVAGGARLDVYCNWLSALKVDFSRGAILEISKGNVDV